jgi:uncharacterized protein (TIGR03437 family)
MFGLVLAVGLQAQTPTVTSVANSASFTSTVSPGTIVSIFGSDFGDSLANATVKIGGLNAPVLFVSNTRINVQFPFNLPVGSAPLQVEVQGKVSATASVTISAHAPAAFTTDGSGTSRGIFTNARGLVTPIAAAAPGDTVTAYMVGLGATNPEVPAGTVTPASPLSASVTAPRVTIGGVSAAVKFAGLYPGMTGVYQVDFVIPQVSLSDYDVVISIGGMSSPAVTLPVGTNLGPAAILRDTNGTSRILSTSPAQQVNAETLATGSSPGKQIASLTTGQRINPNPIGQIHESNPDSLLEFSVGVKNGAALDSSGLSVTTSVASTITYTCDATINAVAGVCAYLNGTIASLYASKFSNITANIYVTFGNSGLGQSTTSLSGVTYAGLRSALIANQSTANDSTAINSSVPLAEPAIFGNSQVVLTNAGARALGFTPVTGGITAGGSGCNLSSAGCYDGVITISSSLQAAGGFYYRSGSITSSQYDFYTVVEHETDEVLGTASCALASCVFSGTTYLAPADLFRYHSNGTRTFGTAGSNSSLCSSSSATNACFSLDGVTMLKQYNNLSNGEDPGDWAPNCAIPSVQNAQGCPGIANLDISPAAEIVVLDVVGYTVQSNPAPGQEIGFVDRAGDINGATTVTKGNTLYAFGWATDTATGAPVQSVMVLVDGSSVGTATLGLARPDVASAFGRSDYINSGWSFQMSTSTLSLGAHTVTARAVGPSGTALLVGSKIVNITANIAGQEIGFLDRAGDVNGAATVTKGNTLYAFGWATDTATGAPVQSVTVLVDGNSAGTATLGFARPDVASAFGRSDYINSGWSLQMSTSTLSLGSHTVTARAVGPSGTALLVGSKTVTIQ